MDYMSDEILNEVKKLEKETNHNNPRKRKKKIPTQPKPLQVLQKESLETGLLTPINESNKGFQMLLKMGYKKGTGLGKESSGQHDPLPLLIKEDRSGIGNKKDQIDSERLDPKKRKIEETKKEELFKNTSKEKEDLKKSIKAMIKIITQICPQLDEQKKLQNPMTEKYQPMIVSTQDITCARCYQSLVIKQGRFGSFLACPSSSCKYKKPLDKDNKIPGVDLYQFLLSLPPEELNSRLLELLEYLRKTHNYCFYCGAFYDNLEQLSKMCPGLLESDH